MKLVYQYMVIFCNFYTKSSHLHPLQVENCDSNSRLVVDEDDIGKFRLERVNPLTVDACLLIFIHFERVIAAAIPTSRWMKMVQ